MSIEPVNWLTVTRTPSNSLGETPSQLTSSGSRSTSIGREELMLDWVD